MPLISVNSPETICIALGVFLEAEKFSSRFCKAIGDKLNTVRLLTDNKRAVSSHWLVGLTVGSYAIVSVALFFFGGGSWIAPRWEAWVDPAPPGELQSFYLLIPGLLIGLLDFVQIHSEALFKQKGNERVARASLWLNAAAILFVFVSIPLHNVTATVACYALIITFLGATVSFGLGIGIGVLHVGWILVHSLSGRVV